MVGESEGAADELAGDAGGFTGDIDGGVFEDDGPFFGVVDSFAGIGGIVLVPFAGDGLREVDDGVLGDIEGTVRAVAGNGEVGMG